jgi:Flp pilus assembly protein CpaB
MVKHQRSEAGAVNPLFQLTVFVVALAILGILSYRQFTRIGLFTRPVVVAATTLIDGSILERQQLQLVRMSKAAAPEGAVGAIADAEGRQILASKQPGEPITINDLRYRAVRQQKDLADLVPQGRVLTTLAFSNLSLPASELTRGDRIDVLVAGGSQAEQRRARVVVRDAYFIGHLRRRNPSQGSQADNILGVDLSPPTAQPKRDEMALILALRPADVVPLAEIDGSGLHINLVLHGTDSVNSNSMLRVEGYPVPKSVDVIAGVERRKVFVQ